MTPQAPVPRVGSLKYTTIRASRYAADEPFRTSGVSFGPSRYQNGGYPTGSRIVEDLLKEAAPAIARMPYPAKIKNLPRLDRQLLELCASRGRNIAGYTKRKAEFGLK